MTKLEEQINQIERIDQLVRMHATGNPAQLAERLKISKASLFRLLDLMKQLKAPIKFDIYLQSYIYEEDVSFKFGFYTKVLDQSLAQEINGGYSTFMFLINGINTQGFIGELN